MQFRHLGKALRFMVKNEEGGERGGQQLRRAVHRPSATIGTGNIVGVATAIVAGGPGALFLDVDRRLFRDGHKIRRGRARHPLP